MNRILVGTLAAAGKPTEVWTITDDSSVLVLPHGGRIFAVPASEINRGDTMSQGRARVNP
jgi:hypothetical protein